MQIQGIYRAKLYRLCLFLMVIGTLGMSATSLRAEGTWAKKADMPTARTGLAAAVVDGIIYVIGGATIKFSTLATMEAYDPETDTWEEKADMPTARTYLSTAVVDGKIYVIGGETANTVFANGVDVYDPVTDKWTRKADMPTSRSTFATAVVDGIIYVIGGYIGGCRGTGTVEAYDPTTDTWTRKADMPTGRWWVVGAATDGEIYAIGGETACGATTSAVEVYDPAADKWTKITNKPLQNQNFAFGTIPVVDGRIYMPGVQGVGSYDPATDAWATEPNLLTPRNGAAAVAVNDRIYVIGGSTAWNSPGLTAVEEFTPEGWPFPIPKSTSVSPQGKMPALWGRLKSGKRLSERR
ncbi:Kelch repeat-containing protein [Candidatus Poribacteria bacterium]